MYQRNRIHVEGTLEGDAEIYVLSPNADIHKLRSCTPFDSSKMKKGKVNVYMNTLLFMCFNKF